MRTPEERVTHMELRSSEMAYASNLGRARCGDVSCRLLGDEQTFIYWRRTREGDEAITRDEMLADLKAK